MEYPLHCDNSIAVLTQQMHKYVELFMYHQLLYMNNDTVESNYNSDNNTAVLMRNSQVLHHPYSTRRMQGIVGRLAEIIPQILPIILFFYS